MNPMDRVLSLIAPDICINCGAEGSILCQECQDLMQRIPSICYACGKASRNFKPCPKCITKWQHDHVWIYSEYSGLAKDLIKSYKFGSARRAAKIMATMMNDSLPYFATQPIITYVPTVPARMRSRGFDHAGILAKEIARQKNWIYIPLLARQMQSRQLGASREQRRSQLKNALRLNNHDLIKGRHILIVDDVVTTGATIEACAKMLKKAGASQIDAAAFARTPNR